MVHGLYAVISWGHRDADESEDRGAVPPAIFVLVGLIAPACHHCLLAGLSELPLCQAIVRQADRHYGLRQSGWLGQAEQSNVIVTGDPTVVRVDEDLLDIQVQFPVVPASQIVLTCKAKMLSK